MASLPLIAGEFPAGYCWPADPQTYLNDLAAITTVQLDVTGARYVISQTVTPAATERDFLWYNPATGHTLFWNSAVTSWWMQHPYTASGDARILWVGTPTNLLSFDGGDGGANPMWMVDTVLAGRVPVGVGTMPSGATVALGATGGSDVSTIAAANLPATKVAVNTAIIGQAGVTGTGSEPVVGSTYGSTALAGTGGAVDATSSALSARYFSKAETDNLGLGTPLNTMPGYFGLYVIKRTARQAYWS